MTKRNAVLFLIIVAIVLFAFIAIFVSCDESGLKITGSNVKRLVANNELPAPLRFTCEGTSIIVTSASGEVFQDNDALIIDYPKDTTYTVVIGSMSTTKSAVGIRIDGTDQFVMDLYAGSTIVVPYELTKPFTIILKNSTKEMK